tara:strand:+ start:537 stop:980 length:444 start_codon:yes stop_codon:yes gene_type:complete
MATFTGHDGQIKFADSGDSLSMTAVGNLRNFTIEQTQDTVENSVMGNGNVRTYLPGMTTFTISGDMYFDGADGVQQKLDDLVSKTGDETLATFEVYPSGDGASENPANTKFSGSCIITSFSITSSMDGMVEASFAAQGSGALALAQL